jgi:hypothetical protein
MAPVGKTLLGLALAGVVLSLTACPDPEPAAAHIRSVTGDVTWKVNDAAEAQPAEVDRGLREGNIVTTAADGAATVEFQGGNKVELQADTTLVIRKAGGSTAQFGAVLLAGSATASSAGQGVLLAIGTPFGLTELGAAESSLELSLEHGITVLVGEVALLTDQGRKTLEAGMTFTIDGIEIQVKKKCESDDDCAEGETCSASSACEKTLKLAPMEFVLLANPKQVQIKRAGTSKWRAPKKREAWAPAMPYAPAGLAAPRFNSVTSPG